MLIEDILAGAVWTVMMPTKLAKYLPEMSSDQIAELYGSITQVMMYPDGDPIREGVSNGTFLSTLRIVKRKPNPCLSSLRRRHEDHLHHRNMYKRSAAYLQSVYEGLFPRRQAKRCGRIGLAGRTLRHTIPDNDRLSREVNDTILSRYLDFMYFS